MLVSKKAFYFLSGLVVLHWLIFFAIYGNYPPGVVGILWKQGEWFLFPFIVSRSWYLLLFPAIFLFWGLFKKSGLWKSDSWDKDEYGSPDGFFFGHFFAIAAGAIIAGIYLKDAGGSSEPWLVTLSALLMVLTVVGLVLWIITVLASGMDIAIYLACIVFFTAGTVAAFVAGSPYFVLISVPAAQIALIIPVYQSLKIKEFVLGLKLKLQKWMERDPVQVIIEKARELKVTPKTKEKILSIVKEVPMLQKEIKKLHERLTEIKSERDSAISQAADAEASALKKDVDECVAAACKKVAEALVGQYSTLDALVREYSASVTEKEGRLKDLLDLLKHAKKEAEFCEEYDVLAKKAMETQKRVKKIMEKISSDLSK